jgi:hypothetical protein
MTSGVYTVKWDSLFSLDLPQDWSWSTNEGVVSIFRHDGVGAIQVSVLVREDQGQSGQAVAFELARSFARQRLWDLPDSQIRTSRTRANDSIAMFEFVEHGDSPTYWQVWHLVNAGRASFITYTCEVADSEVEAIERQRIVDSFRWL